jgi:hypothetical protein
MTLAEAIDWISKRGEATRQMRLALADKAITGLCWEDQRSGMTAVMDSRPDYPPTDREFWQEEASLPDEKGRIFDPHTKRRRTLLIPKQDIFQIWPEPTAASAGSESEKAGPIAKAKVGAPSDKEKIYQAYHRLSQLGHDVKKLAPSELAKLIAKECGKRIGDPRWHSRTVLQHIQDLRAKH